MGRRSASRALGLWMNGAFVGTWRIAPRGETLDYDPAWVASERGRPLSLSLPFQPGNPPQRGAAVRAYFENLLPDSQPIRERVARRHRAASTDAFDLLAQIGRDCVGALEIRPLDVEDDAQPRAATESDWGTVASTPLSEAQVAQVLRGTTAAAGPWGVRGATDDDFCISIAGAQEKTALLRLDGRWRLPHGATATTHILKLPMGLVGNLQYDLRDSVENEWLCALVLKAYGLPVAHCEPARFEDMKALVVERFDRAWWGPRPRRLLRLPQEDLCQATGTPPHLKYEADGGPGIDRIMALLDGSTHRDEDRRCFFRAQIVFWLLCATDGHAKNFSLFLQPGGRYRLTPLYDVLSAYPIVGEGPGRLSPFKARMAMAVRGRNAHWKQRDIHRRHWIALGARHGVLDEAGRPATFIVDDLAARTGAVVEAVRAQLPHDFPPTVAEPILGGLVDAAKRLAG